MPSMKAFPVVLFMYFLITGYLYAAKPAKVPRYVTSQTCSDCHQKQYSDWSKSDHAWAWLEPSQRAVLGDFNDAVFEHSGAGQAVDS